MKNLYDKEDWLDITEPQKIGEILMQAGCMNLKHLDMALEMQKLKKDHIGEILIAMGILTRAQVDAALLRQAEINGKLQ